MTKKERLRQQTELAQYIANSMGINLVDCGNCGATSLQELDEDDHTCPFCGYTSEPCDFPDHFHEGFEESLHLYAEFQDNA